MPYTYKIQGLLNGAYRLLEIVNQHLQGNNTDVTSAYEKVNDALINLGDSELQPALLHYKLTLDSLLEEEDEDILSYPNLSEFNPPPNP